MTRKGGGGRGGEGEEGGEMKRVGRGGREGGDERTEGGMGLGTVPGSQRRDCRGVCTSLLYLYLLEYTVLEYTLGRGRFLFFYTHLYSNSGGVPWLVWRRYGC